MNCTSKVTTDRSEDTSKGALLERWQQTGDVDALDQLIRLELEPLKRAFRRQRLGRRTPPFDTTDFVDGALEAFLDRDELPEFKTAREWRAYVVRSAVNRCIDHHKRTRREVVHVEDYSEDENWQENPRSTIFRKLDESDLQSALDLALNTLPEADRDLIRRFYLRCQKTGVIATELGVTRKTVNQRRKAALVKMMHKLKSWQEWVDT